MAESKGGLKEPIPPTDPKTDTSLGATDSHLVCLGSCYRLFCMLAFRVLVVCFAQGQRFFLPVSQDFFLKSRLFKSDRKCNFLKKLKNTDRNTKHCRSCQYVPYPGMLSSTCFVLNTCLILLTSIHALKIKHRVIP